MRVRDYKFHTSTVCICEPNRYERLYDGPIDRIPEFIKNMRVYRQSVHLANDYTYMEVE